MIEDLAQEGPFDLLLTDTSLFNSLTAAIQSVKGQKVLQIDPNSYYGGPKSGSHKTSYSSADSFTYDPMPIIFYARGPLSSLLLNLELTDYCEFLAVEGQFIWIGPQVLIPLPLSKEQVMLEPALTLLEKRKFMKLLKLAADLSLLAKGEQVPESLADLFIREQVAPESRVFQLIVYGACRCSSLPETELISLETAMKILESLRASLNHLNRTKSPFVLPFWGSSEIVQAACRKAAVFGCIQILGKTSTEIDSFGIKYKEKDPFVAHKLKQVTRKTFLLNRPFLGINGTALITIPPLCDLNPSSSCTIDVLQLSSDTKYCPIDTWIIHIWSLEDFSEDLFMEMSGDSILWQSPKETIQTDLLPASFTSETEFVDSLPL